MVRAQSCARPPPDDRYRWRRAHVADTTERSNRTKASRSAFVLQACGREGDLVPLADRRIDGRSEEVTLDGGSISEWYRNDSGESSRASRSIGGPTAQKAKTSVFLEMKFDGLIGYPRSRARSGRPLQDRDGGKRCCAMRTSWSRRREPENAGRDRSPSRKAANPHATTAGRSIRSRSIRSSRPRSGRRRVNQDGANLGWLGGGRRRRQRRRLQRRDRRRSVPRRQRKALLFLRRTSRTRSDARLTGSGSTGSRFGYAVASAEHQRGDGYDDRAGEAQPDIVLISSNRRSAHPDSDSSSPAVSKRAADDGSQPAASGRIAGFDGGDVDRRCYADVPGRRPASTIRRRRFRPQRMRPWRTQQVLVATGAADLFQAPVPWISASWQSFGIVNADGYADVIIGAPLGTDLNRRRLQFALA